MRASDTGKWLRGMNRMQQRIEEVGEVRDEGMAGPPARRAARRAAAGRGPRTRAGPGQVLVRVLGAAANFPDVLMCRGAYQVRPPLPFTPGVELCGEVVTAGPG